MNRLLTALAVFCLFTAPALAVDANLDGATDGDFDLAKPEFLERAGIGVVDTGDGTVTTFIDRLSALGYSCTPIPHNSDFSVLSGYNLVILPVGHGSSGIAGPIQANAADYIAYVQAGGGLWVGQPNPYNQPGEVIDITWVPYQLTIAAPYNAADCPPCIVNPEHCIIEMTGGNGLSFPADEVVSMGLEWNVLAIGCVTQRPAVFVATYGAGQILVELGHPGAGAICQPSDAAMDAYASCTWGAVDTATGEGNWSVLKALY